MKEIIAMCLIGFFVFAGEYGTIKGKVVDYHTNKPFVDVTVAIIGTEFHSKVDENGEYIFSYVRPGTYTIRATMWDGFLEHSNIRIKCDVTTIVDFFMCYHLLSDPTVTGLTNLLQYRNTKAVFTDNIKHLPITTLNQFITLQPGVVESDFGLHIRGGGCNEIGYYVDGIATTALPDLSSIEEISLINGGFDAEYGDALSGIVNIVTKEGGAKSTGNFCYLTDEIFVTDKFNFGYNHYNFSLGGPIAKRLRYFVSGELMLIDAYQKALHKVSSPREDYRILGKLTYLIPNAKGKITISEFKSREQYIAWSPYIYAGNDLKYFKNRPMSRNKNNILATSLDFMLTNKTMLSCKLGFTSNDSCYGNRDYGWEETHNRKWYDDYRFKAEHLINYLFEEQTDTAITPRHIIVDSLMQYHIEARKRDVQALRSNPYGIEGIFYTYGDYPRWSYLHNDNFQTRLDIQHFIGNICDFKIGVHYIGYNMKYYNNDLPWISNPFWDYYKQKPYEISSCLQSKIDTKKFIANLGIRYDYFNPMIIYSPPIALRYSLNDTLNRKPETYKISPRLGLSLPITNRVRIRFNYGHWYQLSCGFCSAFPKTVAYEFGMDDEFMREAVFGFTAYIKNQYNLPQIRAVQTLPTPYYEVFNTGYCRIKGLEFNLKMQWLETLGVGFTHTLQFAKGITSYAGQFYYDYYYGGLDPYTALPLQLEDTNYWLNYDERHNLKANIDLKFPRHFFISPLRNFTTLLIFSYHSGHPYTPTDFKGNALGDINSMRIPGYKNVDLKFNKIIPIKPINLVFTALIYNLFNTKQIIEVYPTTGKPDDHGDPEPSLGQFGYLSITSPRYSPQADYNHDGVITPVEMQTAYMSVLKDLYADPTNYNGPFRVQLGIGFKF